jgi:hypothetical protein
MSFYLTANVPAYAVKVKQQQNSLKAIQYRHSDAFHTDSRKPFVEFVDDYSRHHHSQETAQAHNDVGGQFEDDEVPGFFFLAHLLHLF